MASNYCILYAEDDLDDLAIISDAFAKYPKQIEVVHAHNGVEALQVLETMSQQLRLPCLIILDINMPLMDGRQTLLKMRQDEKFREIPIVLFSTSKSDTDKKFADSMDVGFFTKPYSYAALQKLVEELVQKCALEKIA